jgi:hypothetical protein
MIESKGRIYFQPYIDDLANRIAELEASLSKASAELDRLNAASVVVPSMTDSDLEIFFKAEDALGCEQINYTKTLAGINAWFVSRARAIGPGEVVVDRAALVDALDTLWGSKGYFECGFDYPAIRERSINALDTILRVQAKQGGAT